MNSDLLDKARRTYDREGFWTTVIKILRYIRPTKRELQDHLKHAKGTLLRPVINRYGGDNFLEEDWDNLIILDACRPDFFERYNPFDGDYSRRTSLGAASSEFFLKNLNGKQFHDVVYVTGNINIEMANEKNLYKIVKTYDNDMNRKRAWLPQVTLNAAKKAYEKHPGKRIVVHFMQPHAPYLGDRANEIRQEVSNKHNISFRSMEVVRGDNSASKHEKWVYNLLDSYEKGYISRKKLVEVYTENLKIAFEYIDELLDIIEGKTIITADHSESFGDYSGIYGHKNYALSSELRTVPWLVLHDNRRDTFTGQPAPSESIDESVVRRNLKELGYM